jgi:glucose-6-phosphate 1-epimerase
MDSDPVGSRPGRRSFLAALLAVALLAPAAASAADAAFTRCLATLQGQAQARGIPVPAFARFTAGLQPDPAVLALLDAQPEFTTPIWDYLAALVDDERVADGRAMLAAHRDLLARIAADSGVDAATIVAVWGVESDYGRVIGQRPLLQSLATLACAGRRQAFFRGELLALLGLLQSGDLADPALTGSWAGAFGQTQFMPTTYARIAVDGDGDGRRDLVGSIPDALASTARYLQQAGWRSGAPWGVEVRLPAGFDAGLAGRTRRRPLQDWLAAGLRDVGGQPLALPALAPDTPMALLLPAGASGPAFLAARNYDAIYAYNAAESYALAIALLADRLRGGPGLVAAWPTDDPGLGRAQRRELQQLLLARGHQIGRADGAVGNATRRAIQAEQARLNLPPVDGRPGLRILTALRQAPAPPSHGDAFALPAAYPRFQQSPRASTSMSLPDVPGLRSGDFHGFPSLLVDTPFATAAISLFGGQLLSFVPTGGQDALWLSPLAKPTPTPIRGGTPVCWPYFGKQDQTGDVPAHGFVRTVPWQLTDARREPDGSVVLALAPPAFDDLPLRLSMTVRVGKVLEQRVVTENTGSAPARFTQALHNYFKVGDALRVDVQGLDGLDYLDKYEGYAHAHRQQGDWNLRDPRDPGRSDRIYTGAGGRYVLTDPVLQRRLVIGTEGSRTLVAWNPGEAAGSQMADVGPGWRDYVCLEAANAGPEVIELAPGGRHTLVQTIAVEPL